MNIKKVLALFLSFVMIFSLVACSADDSTDASNESTTNQTIEDDTVNVTDEPSSNEESTTAEPSTTAPEESTTAEPSTTAPAESTTKEVVTNVSEKESTTKDVVTTAPEKESTTKQQFKIPECVTPDPTELEMEVFNLVNEYRIANGKGELEWDTDLHYVAEIRAEECAIDFSHTRPDGTKFDAIMGEIGYRTTAASENLYRRPVDVLPDAEIIVTKFKESADHNAAMLKDTHTKAGFAFYYDEEAGKSYFVQIFAA